MSGKGRPVAWTNKREDRLRELWTQTGMSASEIAEELGGNVTRNSIIGKARRMKLPAKAPTKETAHKPETGPWKRAAREREMRQRILSKIKAKRPTIPTDATPSKAEAWEALPGSNPVSLADLSAAACRWPIGQESPYLFCGKAHGPGRSYCPEHQAISVGIVGVKPRVTLGFGESKAESASSSDGRFVLANKPAAAIEAQEPCRAPAYINASDRTAA